MEYGPEDMSMSFCTEGIRVELYDTYCKGFDRKDKERFDGKIRDILSRAALRRQLEGNQSQTGDMGTRT